MNDKIFKLKGKVQQYAWGGYTFIPDLLKTDADTNQPSAEYWLGAHSSAPSSIVNSNLSLAEYITQNPITVLGKEVYEKFGALPYLFKVLDVRDMLSIQVHPTKQEAILGFEREEAEGIAINASNRNYKDKNHKPEVMIALSEFWLIHGFKSKEAIEETLTNYLELKIFLPIFKTEGLKALYKTLMELPQNQVNTLLKPLVKKSIFQKNQSTLTKINPEWWIAKLYNNNNIDNVDRGIFSLLLFNIVQLQKGEAIFQAAGIPHAYLEGQNMELMANSDNVLRGGLTPKHIDVPELMKHISFQSVTPKIIKPLFKGSEKIYECPVPDFSISSISLQAGEKYYSKTFSFEILLVIEGALIIEGLENYVIKQGDAIGIIANTSYTFTSTGNTVIYKAFVPEE
jgi:mannose-6-phosphate isomerase